MIKTAIIFIVTIANITFIVFIAVIVFIHFISLIAVLSHNIRIIKNACVWYFLLCRIFFFLL